MHIASNMHNWGGSIIRAEPQENPSLEDYIDNGDGTHRLVDGWDEHIIVESEAHDWSSQDGICEKCGYECNHDSWEHDNSSFDSKNKTVDAKCTVCGVKETHKASYSYHDEYGITDDKYHYIYCDTCYEIIDTSGERHEFRGTRYCAYCDYYCDREPQFWADSTGHGYTCDICGEGWSSSHDYSYIKQYDDNYHYVYCSSDDGYYITEEHSLWWSSYDMSKHIIYCYDCDYNKEEDHRFDSNGFCSDCQYQCPHKDDSGNSLIDENGTCSNCKYTCSHSDSTYKDNGDGTHSKICNTCGHAVLTSETHTYENYKCTACGYINCDHTLPDDMDLHDSCTEYITVDGSNYTVHCKCGQEVFATGDTQYTFLNANSSSGYYEHPYWYDSSNAWKELKASGINGHTANIGWSFHGIYYFNVDSPYEIYKGREVICYDYYMYSLIIDSKYKIHIGDTGLKWLASSLSGSGTHSGYLTYNGQEQKLSNAINNYGKTNLKDIGKGVINKLTADVVVKYSNGKTTDTKTYSFLSEKDNATYTNFNWGDFVDENLVGTDAGNYSITIKMKGYYYYNHEEYQIYYDTNYTYDITINKATMNPTITSAGSLTYDNSSKTLILDPEDVPEDSTITYTVTKDDDPSYSQVFTDNYPTATDSGTYTINYVVTNANYEDATGSVETTISCSHNFIYNHKADTKKHTISCTQCSFSDEADCGLDSNNKCADCLYQYLDYNAEKSGSKEYKGNPQHPDEFISSMNPSNSTIIYKYDDQNYNNLSELELTDVGDYEIDYTITAPYSTGGYDDSTGVYTFSITEGTLDTTVEPITTEYTGNLQDLIIAQDDLPEDTEIVYTVIDSNGDGQVFENEMPKKLNVGTYRIKYKISSRGYAPVSGEVTAKIIEADNPSVIKPVEGLVYNTEDQTLITATDIPSNSTIAYTVKLGDDIVSTNKDLDTEEFINNLPTGNEVGTYTIDYEIINPNYTTLSDSVTTDISIADSQATVKSKDVVYNGDKQNLVETSNLPEGSTVVYKVTYPDGTAEEIFDIPVGTDIGTYKIEYTITNASYNTVAGEVYTEITKLDIPIIIDSKAITEGDTDPELTYTPSKVYDNVNYSLTLTRESGTTPGKYEITVLSCDNSNINIVPEDKAYLTIKEKEVTPDDNSNNNVNNQVSGGDNNSNTDNKHTTPDNSVSGGDNNTVSSNESNENNNTNNDNSNNTTESEVTTEATDNSIVVGSKSPTTSERNTEEYIILVVSILVTMTKILTRNKANH